MDFPRHLVQVTVGMSSSIVIGCWCKMTSTELEADRTYRIDMKGAILTSPGLNIPGTYADPELTLRLPQINAIYDADGGYLFNT